MFSEKEFEDILVKFPELIEPNLKFLGRQVKYFGKSIDILFEDRFKEKLIVELKKDNLTRDALSQVLEYEGYILSDKDPTARVMLIANRIPLNLKKAMDHHGIEYKELTVSFLMEFLEKKEPNPKLLNEQIEFQRETKNRVFTDTNEETEFTELSGKDLEIAVLQFRSRIKNELKFTGTKNHTFPGGEKSIGERYEINTSHGLLSITVEIEGIHSDRFVHYILLDRTVNSSASDIEINIPKIHNGNVACLLIENHGKRFLCNRGKCTVYMKALKKSDVLEHFASKYGNVLNIKENGKITPVIKFAELDSNNLFEQIAQFTDQMKIFKEQFR